MITPAGFREFVSWLFGVENPALTKKDIEIFFFTFAGDGKEESFEKLMSLTAKEVIELEIRGNKLRSIVAISGWDNPGNLNATTLVGFRAFIGWSFLQKEG